MTTVPHEDTRIAGDRPSWAELLRVSEMWASLGIVVMWLAVLVDAVWGPDFVSSDGTRIPSTIAVALFAFLATSSVAKYAFRRDA